MRREWLILVRRRRLIALSLVVAIVGVTIYNYTLRPVYQGISVVGIGEATASNPLARMSVEMIRFRAILERQKAVLKSTELAVRVVGALDPEAVRELGAGPIGTWSDRMLAEWNHRMSDEGSVAPKDAAGALRSRLQVTSQAESTWIEIRFSAYDPKVAADIANAILDAYIRQTGESNNRFTEASKKALGAQVEEKEQILNQQFSGLKEMGGKAGLGDLDVRKAMLEREFRAFQEALVNAQTTRVGREARRKEATLLRGGIAAVRSDPLIRAASAKVAELEDREASLLSSLGPKHPDVLSVQPQLQAARQRLATELSSLEEGADSEYQLAVNEEARLKASMARIQKELNAVETESLGYSIERKRFEASRGSIDTLLQRQANASPVIIDAQVIQNARPVPTPVSPQRSRNFLFSIVAGLVFGVILAWFSDRFDESVSSPEDVKDGIGLPFLGIVPLIPKLPQGAITPLLGDAKTGFADSLRVVRTNIIYGSASERPRVLAFTSASPAEGKSTVAAGLAVLLAQNKSRVLLIDADLRRPSAHLLMGLPQTPGLSGLLSAEGAVTLVTRSGPVRGLDVLAAGAPMASSSERLGSDIMKGLIAQARKRYDWVIIDSPPALGLSDASVIATLSDGIVVVCSGDQTPRQAVRHVADQLKAVKATILGVVLNRVNLRRHSYYYGRYYSPHYGIEGEAGSKKAGDEVRESLT